MSVPHRVGLYYEEFVIGEEYESPGRTSRRPSRRYAGISGDYNQLHTDEEYFEEVQHLSHEDRPRASRPRDNGGTQEPDRHIRRDFARIARMELEIRQSHPHRRHGTSKMEDREQARDEQARPGIVWEEVKLLNQRDEIVAEGSIPS
jgi:hypothetical protein